MKKSTLSAQAHGRKFIYLSKDFSPEDKSFLLSDEEDCEEAV